MLLKNRLFTPGPTPLLPAAQNAMAAFTAHHRTADFKSLFTRVLSDMKDFIGTSNDVLVIASSGTGAMEGSVSNLTSAGDRVLVLTAGRWISSRSPTATPSRSTKSGRNSLLQPKPLTCRPPRARPARGTTSKVSQ